MKLFCFIDLYLWILYTQFSQVHLENFSDEKKNYNHCVHSINVTSCWEKNPYCCCHFVEQLNGMKIKIQIKNYRFYQRFSAYFILHDVSHCLWIHLYKFSNASFTLTCVLNGIYLAVDDISIAPLHHKQWFWQNSTTTISTGNSLGRKRIWFGFWAKNWSDLEIKKFILAHFSLGKFVFWW